MKTATILPQNQAQHKNSYLKLLQEIKQTLVEHEFMSRWTLIEGYHRVGELLKNQKSVTVTQISEELGRPRRHLERCRQFYKKYSDLDMLPEGKNISWHKIVNTYLPETVEKKKPTQIECPYCHKKWEK